MKIKLGVQDQPTDGQTDDTPAYRNLDASKLEK